jgi:tetratricopeptide (TPR) repeat protein
MLESLPGARRLLSVLCCTAFSLSFAPVAAAQAPASTEGARSRVEALLEQGIQKREAGQDAEALDLYKQAVALEPENPRAVAHLGATFHALGRWVPAHTYLTQALGYTEDPYIQRHRSELEEALGTVGDHIGFLEIYGAPPGAEALINGQLVATLPMRAPVPFTVGSYLLEVRLKDHYTLGRPITIAKRVLTREDVALSPHGAGVRAPAEPAALAAAPAGTELPPVVEEQSSSLSWLPWTLGGLGAAAAVTSVVAWQRREYYAERWNDDEACVGVGLSRDELCGDDYDKGQTAQTVMWVSATAAGVFAGGAILSAILISSGGKEGPVAAVRCLPGFGGAQCFGTF